MMPISEAEGSASLTDSCAAFDFAILSSLGYFNLSLSTTNAKYVMSFLKGPGHIVAFSFCVDLV
jgi:hypothetical protein